ncbi:MAG: hypothetical protein IT174_06095 [Acidobacteria bacterium]|nr:hypothetical protein [Acidobacteriota bacterium]
MKITNLIKKLGGREPDGYPFLSVYLNAESNSTGREDYQVWLKKSLSEQARTYKENPEEAERFENAVRKINDFVGGADVASNGIAIFASLGDGSIFETVELDVPFRQNRFFAYDRPYIFPLARAVYQHPRYAVLWADTNKADIYIFDGEDRIRTDKRANEKVENIQNVVTNRTQVGGWSQGRFQRHIDNFHLHHAKEVVGELETLIREKGIDKLVLCGDEAAIMPVLRPQLSKAVEEKVIAVINLSQYDSPEEIRKRTLDAVGIENAAADLEKVNDVKDAARAAAGMGTLGVADTLAALANGQVQELVISADIDAIGYGENEVEAILEHYRPGDGTAPVERPPMVRFAGEIADQLVLRALNTDAKVTLIEDDSLLKDTGGVGSILRYNMNASASG